LSFYRKQKQGKQTMITLVQALDRIDSSEIYFNNMNHSFKDYPNNMYYITSRIDGLTKEFPDNQEVQYRVKELYKKLLAYTD